MPRAPGGGARAFGATQCVVASIAACNRTRLPAFHGSFAAGSSSEVTVPAETETTLVVPLEQAQTAPWPSSRYEISFALHGGTLDEQRTVTTPSTAPAGRTGARIALALESAAAAPCQPPAKVRGPVTVRGRADPELAGQAVVLRTARTADDVPSDLARVRVSGDGTFVLAGWRPAPGYHEVGAAYRSQRPELVDDFAPPLALEVEPDEPAPPPAPPLIPAPGPAPAGPAPAATTTTRPAAFPVVLANRRLRADRRGFVRLRLLCPAASPRPCAETLRIRAGARTLTARSVTLAPGRPTTVRIRLRPAARRSLARARRALTVSVRIGGAPAVRAALTRR